MIVLSRCTAILLLLVAVNTVRTAQSQTLAPVKNYKMPPSGKVTVPAEGGLTFEMKVNGKGPFKTVFDTGAVNIISANFATQLGLRVEEQSADMGAIGGSVKAKTAHIDTLGIGDLVVKDQNFFVIDLPADQGIPQLLIGWEFLQTFVVRMDFQRNELTFIDLSHFVKGQGAAVPLILNKHGNGIYLDARVDGVPGRFLLDSGNEIGFFLNAPFVQQYHLRRELNATLRGWNGKGMGGDSPEVWFARLHSLDLGGIVLRDPVVRLQTGNDRYVQKLAGNIGQSTLKHFTVTVDCPHSVMYLDKAPDWNAREIFNRAGLIYDEQTAGDEVKTVFPGGPAQVAGLQPGDLITAIDGRKPLEEQDDPVFKQPVGTVVHMSVRRNGITHAYVLTLRDVL